MDEKVSLAPMGLTVSQFTIINTFMWISCCVLHYVHVTCLVHVVQDCQEPLKVLEEEVDSQAKVGDIFMFNPIMRETSVHVRLPHLQSKWYIFCCLLLLVSSCANFELCILFWYLSLLA